jgi:hypothetical protein
LKKNCLDFLQSYLALQTVGVYLKRVGVTFKGFRKPLKVLHCTALNHKRFKIGFIPQYSFTILNCSFELLKFYVAVSRKEIAIQNVLVKFRLCRFQSRR